MTHLTPTVEVLSLWHGVLSRVPKRMALTADEICREYGLTLAELRAPSRKRGLVRLRQLTMWRMYLSGRSQSEVARFFRMDPSTVNHACQRFVRGELTEVDCRRAAHGARSMSRFHNLARRTDTEIGH